jgi:signal transduction histidine kinase
MSVIKPWRERTRGARAALIVLAVVTVALYSVLVPVHAVLYGVAPPTAMLIGAGVCGAPLAALVYPRVAIAVFALSAFLLPLAISPDRDPFWPWPWSVPALIALALFIFVVTVQHGWRLGVLPLVIGVGGSLAAPLMLTEAATANAAAADLIVTASIGAATFLVAVLVSGRMRLSQQLSRERELTTLEQHRRALIEERSRIARDLHDVVAHSLSVIQVQSSTARYRLPGLADEVAAEFDDIAATARTSLTEMRRLLGVLRTEDQGPQLAPQQGIADIPALVDSIRRAGVRVGLSLTPPSREPAAAVQITAYRIVQEALSNAVRHAPGSGIAVTVGEIPGALVILVSNEAVAVPEADPGSGHGLQGMRERVALVSGTLSAGPDPDGGWRVEATLPLEEEPR